MTKNVEVSIPNTDIHTLEKIIKGVRGITGKENEEISFEFLMASLFPTCWKNIQADLAHQYTLGYIQGQKDAEADRQNFGSSSDDADCYCE